MQHWVSQSDIKLQGHRAPTPPIFGKSKRVSTVRSVIKLGDS